MIDDEIKELFDESMNKGLRRMLVSNVHEALFNSRAWAFGTTDKGKPHPKIPYLNFPPHWFVQICPPFAAALIRFRVRFESTPEHQEVSVYFDGYSELGSCGGKPYWEIYENSEGETERFLMGEEQEMLEAIEAALRSRGKK